MGASRWSRPGNASTSASAGGDFHRARFPFYYDTGWLGLCWSVLGTCVPREVVHDSDDFATLTFQGFIMLLALGIIGGLVATRWGWKPCRGTGSTTC